MAFDVHRDPARLRQHAREAHDLADDLQAVMGGAEQGDVSVDAEQVTCTVRRAVAELRALSADLAGAAAVEHAESEAIAALRRALLP